VFRTVPLIIISSFSLYTQQWYQCLQLASRIRTELRPDPVEFHSKNKFEKSVHLVSFVIRIYHDAWSPERQICSAYWELLVSRGSVTHCRLTVNNCRSISREFILSKPKHLFCSLKYDFKKIKQKGKGTVTPVQPGQAVRGSGGSGSHTSRQTPHEIGKVVSPAHRPPLP